MTNKTETLNINHPIYDKVFKNGYKLGCQEMRDKIRKWLISDSSLENIKTYKEALKAFDSKFGDKK